VNVTGSGIATTGQMCCRCLSNHDREHLQRYLAATEAPEAWQRWSVERFLLG
jgi:hypothetical protein